MPHMPRWHRKEAVVITVPNIYDEDYLETLVGKSDIKEVLYLPFNIYWEMFVLFFCYLETSIVVLIAIMGNIFETGENLIISFSNIVYTADVILTVRPRNFLVTGQSQ